MVYKLKTDAETRAHVQLLMNFKGMRTENIFDKVTRSGDSHWPATEVWSVGAERPSLRSISKLRKSEGKFMANSIKN